MRVYSDLALSIMRANGSFAGYFQVVLLGRAPSSIPSSAAPASAALLSGLGYQEIVDAHYNPATNRPLVQVSQSSSSAGTPPVTTYNVLLGSDINLPANVQRIYMAAVAFIWWGTDIAGNGATLNGVLRPWIMISDESFGQVVNPGSTLATVAQSPRTLWSWSLRGTGPTANVDAITQGLIRSPGTVAWEPPRTQHVYLYPQKINYVPNPSFEDVGLFGWRAKTTLTRVVGGVDNPLNYYGHVAGTRLESIPVLLTSKHVCISAYVRGTSAAHIQLGLANYDTSWMQTADTLSAPMPIGTTWTRVSFVTTIPDNLAGSGFLAVSDGDFDIDMVLLEQTAALNDYFDGSSQTGIAGDFSWQGVTHQSFSFWYNNRYLVGARLFGTYTTGLVAKNGLVYDWVPAGTSIYTHWDVLSTEDTKQPMVDFASRVIP